MKKLFLIGASLFSILTAPSMYAGIFGFGQGCCGQQQQCCAPQNECPPDEPCGECYCRYVRYEPCYYTTTRCIEEQIPCTKKCCRYVPQQYQVQKCRYVPQYYCETYCRQVPEYYDVPDCKTCKRVICEPQCRYVPKYYWKRECRSQGCAPCNSGCGMNYSGSGYRNRY